MNRNKTIFPMTDASTSLRMRQVKTENTSIEQRVRSILHKMGYRFSLRNNKLYGKPDVILPKHGTVIFVHGCFWHGHTCKKGRLRPVRHAAYWIEKIEHNKQRDKKVYRGLKNLGWKVITIWECQIINQAKLIDKFKAALT